MAHKLETVHISFGLVTIPIGIYSAIEEQDTFSRAACRLRKPYQATAFCPVCNRDVNYDDPATWSSNGYSHKHKRHLDYGIDQTKIALIRHSLYPLIDGIEIGINFFS